MKARLLALAFISAASFGLAQIPYSGADADHGVSRNNGLVDPYTGNLSFISRDLQVAGAVTEHGFSWGRHATSRASQANHFFGLGHNWAHSWQWELSTAGMDEQGRALLILREPFGRVHRFTEISPDKWESEPSVKDSIVSSGDQFTVLRFDAGEVRFSRVQGAFVLKEIMDSLGNLVTLSWEQGRLVKITEPAGRWLKVSYGTLGSPTVANGGASFTIITQVSASNGQTVGYGYDFPEGLDYPVLTSVAYSDGTVARYTYTVPRPGDRLLLASAFDPRGDLQLRGRVFHYRTEPAAKMGQILKITTEDGGVIYSLSAEIRSGLRGYAVQQDNGATVYKIFNPGGNLAEEIDALGYSKKWEYDAGGRGFLIAATDALARVTRFENDANGNVLKTTYPDGSIKTCERDPRGRLLAETNELGYTRHYTRDERGRVIRVQHPDGSIEETTFNGFGQQVTHKDRGGAVSTTIYDPRGLRTRVTNGLGASSTFTYDKWDRVTSLTDDRGNTTRYQKDAFGRLTKTIHADGATTTNDYNPFGQQIKSVDATGATRTIAYDSLGRQTSLFNPLGQETRNVYAPIGQGNTPLRLPIKTLSPLGRTTVVAYDEAGQVGLASKKRTVALGG